MKNSVSNMEHYRDEILEALKDDCGFGKIGGKIKGCGELCPCGKCDFKPECVKNRTLWLMEDYKEPITLTAREKHFVEFIETGYLARDKDDALYWYPEKPTKSTVRHAWMTDTNDVIDMSIFGCEMFKFITWDDEEPWSWAELRKLDVKE